MNLENNINNATILILGGRGHIGHALASRLSHNNSVYVVDNDLFNHQRKMLDNIYYIHANCEEILNLDLPDNIDYVFHFAEYSRVEQSLDDADLVLQNNIRPIIDILLFSKSRAAKLIYSGSSTKFSDNGNYMRSTYAPDGTRWNAKIYWPYIFGVFHRTGWKDWSLSTIFADIIALALVGFGLTGLLLWYLPKHKRMRRRILRR